MDGVVKKLAWLLFLKNAFLSLNSVVFSEILLPINPAEIMRGTDLSPVNKYFMKKHTKEMQENPISLACEWKVVVEIEAGIGRLPGRILNGSEFPIS